MKTTANPGPAELHATIKLGIGDHAKWFHVARQIDRTPPQPVQKMIFGGLLRFVAVGGHGRPAAGLAKAALLGARPTHGDRPCR